MIYSNIKNKNEYKFLDEKIQKCFEYIEENNLKDMEKATYEIDGKDIFVNIVEYETTKAENRFWEAHKQYIDIHFMLEGKEYININFIDDMEKKPYIEKDDFLELIGDKKISVLMKERDFLICYPNDAHMTAVEVENPEKIKKAIFKVIV